MSKRRPGVEAGMRLLRSLDTLTPSTKGSEADDPVLSLWEHVSKHQLHEIVVPKISGLAKMRKNRDDLLLSSSSKEVEQCVSKEELFIIPWKFTVGKPRMALMGYLKSNSNNDVTKHTKKAIHKAMTMPDPFSSKDQYEDNQKNKLAMKECIDEITKELKGVGPATASAILSVYRPDIFCYMYDEVIDILSDSNKREYTVKVYLEINCKCIAIARKMNRITNGNGNGNGNKDWNAFLVSEALWAASRVLVYDKQKDVTTANLEIETPTSSKKRSKPDDVVCFGNKRKKK